MKATEIWRYPVKTMAGEKLQQVRLGPLGIGCARTPSHALGTTGKERWTMVRRGCLIALLLTGLFAWTGPQAHGQALRPGQLAADLTGGPWINSPALSMEGLRGRVVLLEFWTYG